MLTFLVEAIALLMIAAGVGLWSPAAGLVVSGLLLLLEMTYGAAAYLGDDEEDEDASS